MMPNQSYKTDDQRWAAIEVRDTSADGEFFSAVKTTGIVCRPSCPGRPLRRNVSFYEDLDSALAQGFRLCKRCKPELI